MRIFKKGLLIWLLALLSLFFICLPRPLGAEVKMEGLGPGRVIPKLPKTANDPELSQGHVYPSWGPVCQRYTYSTVYKDKEGRKPEYVKIYFNGEMLDMEKEGAGDNDYKKGVKYIYKSVPTKIDSNFYYFEASNGLGKARDSIIDSPDNGPVLFESAFEKNEIAVIERETGNKVLNYPTGKEWVGGVALSDDGKYLAANTSFHVYLFDTARPEKPVWEYSSGEGGMIGDNMGGGIALSGDGSRIIAATNSGVALFDRQSNKPIWQYQAPAIAVAISKDGKYMAASSAGGEGPNTQNNAIVLWSDKSKEPLWQYGSDSNFHDVSLSDDGQFIAASTGCPDRKAYIFSKDSKEPIVKSDQLTYDSPVSRSRISRDGSLAAFSTEGGPNSNALLLFSKDSKEPLWKFSEPKQKSVRALGMTPDGKYMAIANMDGDVFLFSKDNNTPLANWQINASIGVLALADDGSFLAVGGTDNKVYLLDKDKKTQSEVKFNEFIEKIDISGNGKYIAAGTGGATYFFESVKTPNRGKVFKCDKIIEPKPQTGFVDGTSPSGGAGRRGGKGGRMPDIPFIAGFVVCALTLLGYVLVVKFNLLRKPEGARLTINKKVVIILSVLTAILLATTLYFIIGKPMGKPSGGPAAAQTAGQTNGESQIQEGQKQEGPPAAGGSNVCGNTICEPGLGETKENCPQDCSAK